MTAYVWLPIGLLALVKGYRLVRGCRSRRAAGDPLRRVFGRKELHALDEHLERIAVAEQACLDGAAARYVTGVVGHVVAIYESPQGVALGLSDGGRLTLGGVSCSSLSALRRRAADDKLFPARVVRDAFSYRLVLRTKTGADFQLTTRRLALALAP